MEVEHVLPKELASSEFPNVADKLRRYTRQLSLLSCRHSVESSPTGSNRTPLGPTVCHLSLFSEEWIHAGHTVLGTFPRCLEDSPRGQTVVECVMGLCLFDAEIHGCFGQ